jgi:hypothetical protein
VGYRLEADWEVFHFLRTLGKTDEEQLIRWIDRVRNSPFLEGNYTVRDATDREIQVTKVCRFLVFH